MMVMVVVGWVDGWTTAVVAFFDFLTLREAFWYIHKLCEKWLMVSKGWGGFAWRI